MRSLDPSALTNKINYFYRITEIADLPCVGIVLARRSPPFSRWRQGEGVNLIDSLLTLWWSPLLKPNGEGTGMRQLFLAAALVLAATAANANLRNGI
jgi:hypothetical protein